MWVPDLTPDLVYQSVSGLCSSRYMSVLGVPGQLVCIRTVRWAVGVELKGDRPTGGVWCEVHVTNTPRTADWVCEV